MEESKNVVMNIKDCDGNIISSIETITIKLTEEQTSRLAEERDLIGWCKCGEDYGVDYYEDSEHPILYKHHYRCKKCKDVVQIG